jgi:hypothetical protein
VIPAGSSDPLPSFGAPRGYEVVSQRPASVAIHLRTLGRCETSKRRPPFAAVSPPNLETSAPFTSVLSPARANTETGAVAKAGSQAPADVAFPPKCDSGHCVELPGCHLRAGLSVQQRLPRALGCVGRLRRLGARYRQRKRGLATDQSEAPFLLIGRRRVMRTAAVVRHVDSGMDLADAVEICVFR